MVFGRDPVKLDAKALQYEQRGKTAKAMKYREKAARLRASHGTVAPLGTTTPLVAPLGTTTPLRAAPLGTGFASAPLGTAAPLGTTAPLGAAPLGTGFTSARTPQRYEQNALKWEQRGNWAKAQKNREKVWRLQNPHYGPQTVAPQFYQNNRFLGYNVPFAGAQGAPLQQGFPLQKGFQQGLPLQQGLQQGLPLQQGFQQGLPLQQGFQQGLPLQQGFQQGFQQGSLPATLHNVLPTTVERHVHPTVVQQTARPEKIVEIQPVVHREIEAPRVHVVEKHLYETVPSTGPGVVTRAPIVEETVRPRIVEEIQPVVHREVPAPFVERVEQHVTEHITQPTTMTKEVINDATVRPMGMAAGGPAVPLTHTTTTATGGPLAGVRNTINNITHRR